MWGDDISGHYQYHEITNDRPAYKHETEDSYLFYAGWWKVEPGSWYNNLTNRMKPIGYIKSDDDAVCPEKVPPASWKYNPYHWKPLLERSPISLTIEPVQCMPEQLYNCKYHDEYLNFDTSVQNVTYACNIG